MKVVVATVYDFENGDRTIIDVNGKSVGVFRIDDQFYAIRNRCPCVAETVPVSVEQDHVVVEDSPTRR
jgi:hypothetical protein